MNRIVHAIIVYIVGILLKISSRNGKLFPYRNERQELYLLAETESASMLIDYLRDMMCENGQRLPVFASTELRLLDRYRSISCNLLRKQPLHRFISDGKLNVLVLGFGRVGQAFFRAACSQGMIYNCATKFTLCDQQIDSKLHTFLSQCPELKKYVSIRSRQLDADTEKLEELVQGTDFHYIVVALGDDERDIRVASRLKRFYRTRHWKALSRNESPRDISPQICVHLEDAIKQDYTRQLWQTEKDWDHPLFVFGGPEYTFTRDVLMPEKLWNAARWIHCQLNGITDDKPMQWSEYERRSSIACAAHAEYHVASVRTGHSGKTYAQRLSNCTAEEREAFNKIRGIGMAKTWRPELWEPIKIELELPENYYGPNETKSFYDPQDPRQAYEVRGVRPPSRAVTNPERDAY